MGKILFRLLPGLLLAAACATTGGEVAGPRPRVVPTAGGGAGEAAAGRRLYERSCQRCHALHMPRSYSAGEWRMYVRKYGRKARLRPAERRLVLAYLSSGARR